MLHLHISHPSTNKPPHPPIYPSINTNRKTSSGGHPTYNVGWFMKHCKELRDEMPRPLRLGCEELLRFQLELVLDGRGGRNEGG